MLYLACPLLLVPLFATFHPTCQVSDRLLMTMLCASKVDPDIVQVVPHDSAIFCPCQCSCAKSTEQCLMDNAASSKLCAVLSTNIHHSLFADDATLIYNAFLSQIDNGRSTCRNHASTYWSSRFVLQSRSLTISSRAKLVHVFLRPSVILSLWKA